VLRSGEVLLRDDKYCPRSGKTFSNGGLSAFGLTPAQSTGYLVPSCASRHRVRQAFSTRISGTTTNFRVTTMKSFNCFVPVLCAGSVSLAPINGWAADPGSGGDWQFKAGVYLYLKFPSLIMRRAA
jgi:hypothetical protein